MRKVQGLVLTLLVAFAMLAGTAMAQQRANVGQAVAGLINVNIGAVQVDISDNKVLNNFTLVDVDNVLNNANIEILNNVLNRSPILSNNSEILTNLLSGANLITDNQVVVGVLSGGILLIQ